MPTRHKKELTKLNRRIKTLQSQLGKLGPVMRGSVVIIGTRNKQPYFSLNKNKKTQLIYLGKRGKIKPENILKTTRNCLRLLRK